MYGSEFFNSSFWWLFPILMIAMCFFMMKVRRDSLMCGCGSRDTDSQQISASDSAIDILDKRHVSGDINKEEHEERKRTLTESTGYLNDCE